VRVIKAHAYGNDFLFVALADGRTGGSELARALCDRHQGIGADGLILYGLGDRAAAMTLFNADGGAAELSGNGLRCLAAVVAWEQQLPAGTEVRIETDAGVMRVELLAGAGRRYTCRAALGPPEDIRQARIPVGEETVTATVFP